MSMRQPESNEMATNKVKTLPSRARPSSHFSQKKREVGRPPFDKEAETWRRSGILARHLRNRTRLQALKESARAGGIVFLVRGKHNQEEAVFRCHGKARHVEHRMIRHGQTVQREHAEHRGDSGKKN